MIELNVVFFLKRIIYRNNKIVTTPRNFSYLFLNLPTHQDGNSENTHNRRIMINLIDYISKNKISSNMFDDIAEQTHMSEDWEILNGLIFCYNTNEDRTDIAFNLLQEFGNLPTILSQNKQSLMRVDDVTNDVATSLSYVRRAATLIAEKRILKKAALNNWQAIENYCRTVIGYSGRQNVMAIYLDAEFQPMRAEQISKGTVNQVSTYPREIIGRILELDAYSVILAKNIPTGRLEPKPCEVYLANKLKGVCESLDIHFMDAVLVGKSGARSMLKN